MCTPCALSKLEKWRLRDRAIWCFACMSPPVEEQRKFCPTLPPQMPCATTRVPREHHDLRPSSAPRMPRATISKPRRHKNSSRHVRLERESVERLAKTSSSRLPKKVVRDDPSCPRYADDDYIVFCFREDGVFHLARDANSKPTGTRRSSRPVNRKLIYGENAVDTSNEDAGKDVHTVSEEDDIISDTKGEGKGSFYLDNELAVYDGKRGETCNEEKSRGSNQSSDSSSTASFAFPVLRREWVGSPVHMPKSRQLSRKHRACSACTTCSLL